MQTLNFNLQVQIQTYLEAEQLQVLYLQVIQAFYNIPALQVQLLQMLFHLLKLLSLQEPELLQQMLRLR